MNKSDSIVESEKSKNEKISLLFLDYSFGMRPAEYTNLSNDLKENGKIAPSVKNPLKEVFDEEYSYQYLENDFEGLVINNTKVYYSGHFVDGRLHMFTIVLKVNNVEQLESLQDDIVQALEGKYDTIFVPQEIPGMNDSIETGFLGYTRVMVASDTKEKTISITYMYLSRFD